MHLAHCTSVGFAHLHHSGVGLTSPLATYSGLVHSSVPSLSSQVFYGCCCECSGTSSIMTNLIPLLNYQICPSAQLISCMLKFLTIVHAGTISHIIIGTGLLNQSALLMWSCTCWKVAHAVALSNHLSRSQKHTKIEHFTSSYIVVKSGL